MVIRQSEDSTSPVYSDLKHFLTCFQVSPVPGTGGDSRAAAVEGDMCGVGGEPRQDAVGLAVWKRVDLHCVVGARRHQLPFL